MKKIGIIGSGTMGSGIAQVLVLRKMVRGGLLGRKTGKGFYTY